MFLGKYIQLKCNCNLETKIGFANKRCMPTKCLLDNIYVRFGLKIQKDTTDFAFVLL